ncbi:Rossmann fold domain-containing protein [Altererythrobacter sp. MF3-039]|uniref:Rossmann fold domain-containing protein n=1 Tax=Altererythrobacter sp. MF3-039 TaxID=3252901 RepID=UPI00390C7A7B
MAGQAELRIAELPDSALEAAGVFHSEWIDKIADALSAADEVVIVMSDATYDHDDWRRSAARDLARANAPKRVNVVAGSDEAAIAATLSYLAGAPGVTGQYLKTHG